MDEFVANELSGPDLSATSGAPIETAAAEDPAGSPVAPWLYATAADLGDRDFETPIAGSASAKSYELSEAYRLAAQAAGTGEGVPHTPEARLFLTLSAVTGMHLKPREREEPYGPMLTMVDGRRSAIPADFRDGHLDLFADMAMRAANPVLRARLADVSWLLDRRRAKLGVIAIAAYVETVEAVEAGSLKFPDSTDSLDYGACDLLYRALHLGRTMGWDKPETLRARAAVVRLRERAIVLRSPVPVLWFGELDLDFGVSDPFMVAAGVEEVLAATGDAEAHTRSSLWRLAARSYHLARRDADKYRCQAEAAETMVIEAERLFAGQGITQASAMLASHMMSNAIAQLHGIPDAKVRRTALRHQLVDMQARIPDEMTVYSQQYEINDIAEKVRDAMGNGGFLDQLFLFAGIAASPDPAALVAEAEQSIREHPLSTLFPTVYYDREGKTVHRSGSGRVRRGGRRGNKADDRPGRGDPPEPDRHCPNRGRAASHYGPTFRA